MGQIGGHNVRLEDIDIHADAHSLSTANGAHRGDGRLAVVKGFAPAINTKIRCHHFGSQFVLPFQLSAFSSSTQWVKITKYISSKIYNWMYLTLREQIYTRMRLTLGFFY